MKEIAFRPVGESGQLSFMKKKIECLMGDKKSFLERIENLEKKNLA